MQNATQKQGYMDKNEIKSSHLVVRMEYNLHNELKKFSKENGVSVSEVMRQLVGDLLNMDHRLNKTPNVVQCRKKRRQRG